MKKSILPASHLLRQFLLFSLTIVFLLTVLRATYAMWHFDKIQEYKVVVPVFVHGLRFDIALIGLILIIPVIFGSLLSVSKKTVGIAKFIVTLCLLSALFFVLLMELMTPWFIQTTGLRPDLTLLREIDKPFEELLYAFSNYTVPLVIALIVSVLMFFAFSLQMNLNRFLRFRVFAPTGILLGLLGGFICLLAIRSTLDFTGTALSPADSLISPDKTVNDLVMNTSYKTLHSIVMPYFGVPELAVETEQ